MSALTIRCSSLPRLTSCAASSRTDGAIVATDTPEAKLGTAVHHYLAFLLDGHEIDAAEIAHMFGVDAAELAYLCAAGKRCWKELAGNFPTPQTEVHFDWEDSRSHVLLSGHLDVLATVRGNGITVPDEVRVADWKTGRVDEDYKAQLMGYAYLALAHHPTAYRAYACVVWLREEETDGWYWTREELQTWWQDLVHRLRTEQEVYRPGRHCTYCPRGASCPAKTDLIRQAASALLDTHADYLPSASPPAETLIELLDRAKLVEEACAMARTLIKANVAAAGGTLQADDGRQLVLRQQQQRKIVLQRGYDILCQAIGEPALRGILDVGKTKVEDAIHALAPHGKKKLAVKELMDRLDEAGAVRTTTIERLEVKRGDNTTTAITASATGAG